MAWGVDHLETWNLQIEIQPALHSLHVLQYGALWEIGGTDLLCDTTGLTSLHISPSQLVKDEGFTRVDVTQNTQDGAPQFNITNLLLLLALKHLLLSCLLLCLALLKHLLTLLLRLMTL